MPVSKLRKDDEFWLKGERFVVEMTNRDEETGDIVAVLHGRMCAHYQEDCSMETLYLDKSARVDVERN